MSCKSFFPPCLPRAVQAVFVVGGMLMNTEATLRGIKGLQRCLMVAMAALAAPHPAPTSTVSFSSSYLVTNLMGADLNNIVKFQRLSDEHVQFLIYQLLRGLKVTGCIVTCMMYSVHDAFTLTCYTLLIRRF